ncbi:abortive infection family protein [Xanthomonas arboricola]|uniref:abortive infection family protein n=1 Tax=Xanthomonas arboricola TaxID=56448 RepID=UPI0015E47013|nr:abortive infection family protein [Xanthomonas arboricola]
MNIHDALRDPSLSGKLMLALQRAVSGQFTISDWEEFGYETGEHDYITSHERLRRSLYFGDDDYGACVFQALRYFATSNPSAIETLLKRKDIRRALENESPELLHELGLIESHVPSLPAGSISAPQVVERALADADHLLLKSGPVSCIDRLHTALHGYLKDVCLRAGLIFDDQASLTQLFKLLRARHPKLQHLGSQDKDVVRVLNSFSSVVDALNTIRNHASVAHPNDKLLDDAEAMLMVNATRTLFHYLNTKV